MSVSTNTQIAICAECDKEKPLAEIVYFLGRGDICIECVKREWDESYG